VDDQLYFKIIVIRAAYKGLYMKMVSLIIVVLYLLQPLACFAHPCDSCLGNQDIVDTTGNSKSHTHSQNADNCDSTFCCADYVVQLTGITVNYTPLVSSFVMPERYNKLPTIVIPIFIPPQNFA
jgi:hypothetical protein